MFDFPLVSSPQEMRDQYLNCLFSEDGDVYDLQNLTERCEAFICLTAEFLALQNRPAYEFDDIIFEPQGLRLMLGRLQRDAFGVGRLWTKLDQLIPDPAVREQLKNGIMDLGIRVGSDKPRKTRIAAVFSLWMCVFRPVSICWEKSQTDPDVAKFCAALNFWIAKSYLSKFGRIIVGPEFREHTNRILHDFTYREINLSSLEVLYCGIFRPHDAGENGHTASPPAPAVA